MDPQKNPKQKTETLVDEASRESFPASDPPPFSSAAATPEGVGEGSAVPGPGPSRSTRPAETLVDEASRESFPASDPPSFSSSAASPEGAGEEAAEPMPSAQASAVDRLLRGEIAAVEAYRIAADRATDPLLREQLERILRDHTEAAAALTRDALQAGARPATGTGALGLLARGAQRAASAAGVRHGLRALRAAEVRRLLRYERSARDGGLPQHVVTRIRDALLPRQQEHVTSLDDLLASR